MSARLSSPPGRHEELLRADLLAADLEGERAVRVRPPSPPSHPVSTWIPSAANASSSTAEASGSSPATSRSAASTTVTRAPNRANTCANSQPMAPPPSTTTASGDLGQPHRVAVGPVRRVRQPVDRRGGGLGAGVEHHALRGDVRRPVDLDPAGSGEPAVAADEPDPRLLEPVDRCGVVPVVGGLVADPRRHGGPVGLDLCGAAEVGDPVAPRRPGGRRRSSSSTARSRSRGTRRRRAGSSTATTSSPARASLMAACSPPGPRPSTTTSTSRVVIADHPPGSCGQRDRCRALGEAEEPEAAEAERRWLRAGTGRTAARAPPCSACVEAAGLASGSWVIAA